MHKPRLDSDHDGLDNYTERTSTHTEPNDPDSDDDCLTDGEEAFIYHTDPLAAISHPESGQTLLDGYVYVGADADQGKRGSVQLHDKTILCRQGLSPSRVLQDFPHETEELSSWMPALCQGDD